MQKRTYTSRHRFHSHRAVVALVVGMAFAVGIAMSPAVGHASSKGRAKYSFGRIPRAAFTQAGINWALAPDYVAVLRRGTVVGYVSKAVLDQSQAIVGPRNGGTFAPSASSILPVVNQSLRLVGHFYPAIGFVAVNKSVPDPVVTPTTVYGPPLESSTG